MDENIVYNPDFKLGLQGWHSNSCSADILSANGQCLCRITKRKEHWHGLEQVLTPQLQPNVKYFVMASVMAPNAASKVTDMKATLRLENLVGPTEYRPIGMVKASSIEWSQLQGTFLLDDVPQKVIFYIEGPPAGIDILVRHVDIRVCGPAEQKKKVMQTKNGFTNENVEFILRNPDFERGLEHWYGRGCKLLLSDPSKLKESTAMHIAVATGRTTEWQGIEQNVTGKLKGYKTYKVFASVRIDGSTCSAQVLATLWIKDGAGKEQYITLAKAIASSTQWRHLEGDFMLDHTPEMAVAYIEGPPAGVDLLIKKFSIFYILKPPTLKPVLKDAQFGVNIVENSGFLNGLNAWDSLGSCVIELHTGAPLILPPAAKESFDCEQPVSGIYVMASQRTHDWEGPSQNMNGKIQPFVTYQVSAWVRIGQKTKEPQKVNVALGVDGVWVNGGEVEGDSCSWKEIAGSFRLETKPENVILYVQGPSANVDLMVANLMVFAVDRTARFQMLKMWTDKIRKRDIMIRVRSKQGIPVSNAIVDIKHTKHTFPLGSCINSYSIKRLGYLEFFFKNFNWAVFENELKWYWTEKERGKTTYADADMLCRLCTEHQVHMRGHCIFWEADDAVQMWVKELDHDELAATVQKRLIDVVSRFKGKFQHYDVNNEMLHGSFYKDRLGAQILPYMFELVKQFDPVPKLFVNDYHVVDGMDSKSSPEKYIQHIQLLQAMGAPIGGIGVQGHISYPVGSVIKIALDKLATLGLPIWFTEVDVETPNEFLRGEDLEVVLREAFAHPAVEGVMLWGFMENAMHRKNSHLVDADGTINEAGKTLVALKQEWQTTACGTTDDMGCFYCRCYQGAYTLTVKNSTGESKTTQFEVSNGGNMSILDVII